MASWVGSCQITRNQINLDLVQIIQFCWKIYDMWRHLYPWVGVWAVGWVDGLELIIKIVLFCLKIYDLCKLPHLWVGRWVE